MSTNPLTRLVFVPIGVYMLLMTALAAFVVHPPLLGWIGLGVATVVALLIGMLGVTFFSRMRTNAERMHPRSGTDYRLVVVVTDVELEPSEIREAVESRAFRPPTEIRVVAPVIATGLHFLSADELAERAGAAQRLQTTLSALAEIGIPAGGVVGTDDPLQAAGDVLADFPADEILLVGSPRSQRSWLDRDFERRARDAFGVPVSSVVGAKSTD